jgi:hypothetical protein
VVVVVVVDGADEVLVVDTGDARATATAAGVAVAVAVAEARVASVGVGGIGGAPLADCARAQIVNGWMPSSKQKSSIVIDDDSSFAVLPILCK